MVGELGCAVDQLHLEVPEFDGPTRWRWRLTTQAGAFLADHQVNLDAGSAEYEAFSDLHSYLHRTAAPDRTLESEAEWLEWVGRWIGTHVWGPVGPAMLKH